jgi:hypothetical protein
VSKFCTSVCAFQFVKLCLFVHYYYEYFKSFPSPPFLDNILLIVLILFTWYVEGCVFRLLSNVSHNFSPYFKNFSFNVCALILKLKHLDENMSLLQVSSVLLNI